MLLTIIVPSLNQNRFIGRTLDSILSQSHRPLEVIVCDGASSDGTVDTLRRYAEQHPELRWVSQADDGPAAAVNRGLGLARGEIAGIQSSDDIYYPGAFAAAVETFRRQSDCGFVIGDCHGIDEHDAVLYTEVLPEFSWEAYFARSLSIPQSSIFFRTDLARQVGGWNPAYYTCDTDFWLRVLLNTRALHVRRVLSGWRLYRGQRTAGREAAARIWQSYWRMIEDSRELREAPARVQRMADASRHLLAPNFHATGNPWAVRWHLLRGFLKYPAFCKHYPWALWRWLPGIYLARQLYRRARDAMPA